MIITEVEKQIEILADEINDIFHATELNLDAVKIQLEVDGRNDGEGERKGYVSGKYALITECQKQFNDLKFAYQQRSNLRLQYLINEQIKSQQQKVRKQRLLQYEDKIYDHRRLICDKESFYDTLIKPKIKRPPGMTNQQFQDFRIKEVEEEERGNFWQLQQETQMLLKLEKVFRNHRILLEEELKRYQKTENSKGDEDREQGTFDNAEKRREQGKTQEEQAKLLAKQVQRGRLLQLAESIPIIYQSFDVSNTAPINLQTFHQAKRLLSEYMGIGQSESNLMSEYKEEREMYRYLKWEKDDLVKKYKNLQTQIKQLRQKNNIKEKRININRENKRELSP